MSDHLLNDKQLQVIAEAVHKPLEYIKQKYKEFLVLCIFYLINQDNLINQGRIS